MKRKIEITSGERTMIVAALAAYQMPLLASLINSLFNDADSANDGPEVRILSVKEPQ
jgi:hypothetical protein